MTTPKLPGFKTFHEFAPDEKIVGITTYNGVLLVATDKNIYESKGDKLALVMFDLEPEC